MTPKRYVVEGEWSGYRSSQRRVVHRTITRRPSLYENLRAIEYTDGTTLLITLRPCEPRERVNEIYGYSTLIDDAAHTGKSYVRVADLKIDWTKGGGA